MAHRSAERTGLHLSGEHPDLHFSHGGFVHSLPIDRLLNPPHKTIEHRTQEAEILSVKRIDSGRMVRLTASEWTTRVKVMRESNPEFFNRNWQSGAIKTWHQHQRLCALRDGNLYATSWNIQARHDSLGDEYQDRLAHETERHFFSAIEQATAGDMDKAAAHVQQISVTYADLFALHTWAVPLESLLLKDAANVMEQLQPSGHDAEAMKLFNFAHAVMAVRFARDSRHLSLGIRLARDAWQRKPRPKAIAYYERSRPGKFVLGYHAELNLMQPASGQSASADVLLREMLAKTDTVENAEALRGISLTALAFPALDAELAEQVRGFIERLQIADRKTTRRACYSAWPNSEPDRRMQRSSFSVRPLVMKTRHLLKRPRRKAGRHCDAAT